MKKYFYSLGLHKEGGLNILKKFMKENDNYIYILDKRLIGKIKKIKTLILKVITL